MNMVGDTVIKTGWSLETGEVIKGVKYYVSSVDIGDSGGYDNLSLSLSEADMRRVKWKDTSYNTNLTPCRMYLTERIIK